MRILVNGAPLEAEAPTLHGLAERFLPGCPEPVVILNGYQTGADAALREGDEVTLIRRGELPAPELLERMMRARNTPGVYDRLRDARVAVAGLGGLGSHVALQLARTGVGHLLLVDHDVVEPSNLNRQQYGIRHLGLPKAEALAQQIAEVSPLTEVDARRLRVTEALIGPLFAGAQVVCECFDDPEAKAMLVNGVLTQCREAKVVAASGMAGYGSGNAIVTRRVGTRLYLCGDGHTAAAPGCGLMAPRVSICAGHQANAALRILMGIEEA